MARRLAEGVELRSSDPYGYFCGVAHLVYKEVLRRAAREHRALESGDWPAPSPLEDDEPSDERLDCLRRCLQQLPADQRDLVLRYHQGENNIRNRQALADQIGIPMNALRIRVHRVRRKLEAREKAGRPANADLPLPSPDKKVGGKGQGKKKSKK